VPPAKLLEEIRADREEPERLLDRLLMRRRIERLTLEKERTKQKGEEEERVIMAQIDWHDFVVVETIEFNADEDQYLPAPCHTIEEMNAMLLQQAIAQENTKHATKALAEEDDMDVDMDMDVDDKPAAKKDEAEENAAEIRRSIEVAKLREQKEKSTRFQRCPICNELIPLEDIR
jgi:splicing factor 3A subunit 1